MTYAALWLAVWLTAGYALFRAVLAAARLAFWLAVLVLRFLLLVV